MKDLINFVANRAIAYQQSLDDRKVAPPSETVARLSEFNVPLQSAPIDAAEVIAQLDEIGSPATVATTGGRYFGFVIGGSLPAAQAANWFVDLWDQNATLERMSPVSVMLEEIALDWLLDIFGLPSDCGGAFVTGCCMANLTGLAAARHRILARAGWDVEADGLFGAPPITVVVSAEAHPTLHKSLGLLGLGRKRVITVPTDSQGRMPVDAIPPLSQNTIVCIQAGNVNTGSYDPADKICEIAHKAGAWVHVDGAFGLWAVAAPERAYLMSGFNQADSLATDGHKWLNVPYDCGLAFVRDRDALRASMSITAAYIQQIYRREPADYTPEASRRARGVVVWAALRSLGREGLADLVERTCRHAKRFAEGLSAAGFQILNDVVLNQVLVSFGDAEKTRRVITAIQVDGTCWCGETVWQGHTAMRISVSSWATTENDVERSLAAMIRIAREN